MTSEEKTAIYKRIMQYCAKAERCTQDVVQKLTAWNAPDESLELILEKLRNDKFLDDERYAISYVADKWKLDQWGRNKIRNGLFQKGFREMEIQTALEAIDQKEYISRMQNLLAKKRDTILQEPAISQMKKILSFGHGRGFEEELIWQWLEQEGLSFDSNITQSDEADAF